MWACAPCASTHALHVGQTGASGHSISGQNSGALPHTVSKRPSSRASQFSEKWTGPNGHARSQSAPMSRPSMETFCNSLIRAGTSTADRRRGPGADERVAERLHRRPRHRSRLAARVAFRAGPLLGELARTARRAFRHRVWQVAAVLARDRVAGRSGLSYMQGVGRCAWRTCPHVLCGDTVTLAVQDALDWDTRPSDQPRPPRDTPANLRAVHTDWRPSRVEARQVIRVAIHECARRNNGRVHVSLFRHMLTPLVPPAAIGAAVVGWTTKGYLELTDEVLPMGGTAGNATKRSQVRRLVSPIPPIAR